MPHDPAHVPQPSRVGPLLRGCIGLCAALVLGSALAAPEPAHKQGSSATQVAKAKKKAVKPKGKTTAKAPGKATAKAREQKPGPLADFGGTTASPEVVHIANWASYTRNPGGRGFVVIDKKQARMYVFDRSGKLKGNSQVLLGKAVGDTSAPGVGNKPLAQLKESEKTTPAGRFLALPGKNMRGDDIIWIDYNAAVSMHRMHSVSASEKRADRMASETPDDNRISNGCVNVPPSFYNKVLRPTVLKQGAYVYVLPETRTPQQMFGSYDVPAAGKATAVAKDGGDAAKKSAKS
ncbi:L,D-transpeptidase [Ramlibacter sp. USB13]|uniref:L,D-transpeptidase n=1 Tax=Ramlibacter cellulosilyticus TaxID=2764187 RepID=A0A923MKU5_9BURK|nr:L,D-transpeptidase [Ramlibacter cellulosilyticus]MBC5781370.1 L,D-transpeptidase [Ramlibacter cellulosilyticus]